MFFLSKMHEYSLIVQDYTTICVFYRRSKWTGCIFYGLGHLSNLNISAKCAEGITQIFLRSYTSLLHQISSQYYQCPDVRWLLHESAMFEYDFRMPCTIYHSLRVPHSRLLLAIPMHFHKTPSSDQPVDKQKSAQCKTMEIYIHSKYILISQSILFCSHSPTYRGHIFS